MDLKSAASVTPTSYYLAATDTMADIIPTVASGGAIKVESMLVTNVEGATAQAFDLIILDGATTKTLASGIEVPAKATLEFFGRPFWLTEGQSLRGKSNASDQVVFTAAGLEFA